MRVALVHYWLLGMRGGERVLESLCRLYPDADIFTLFYDPAAISETIRKHKVTASFLNPLRRFYRSLLPVTPLALEQFDLRGYDLVISSESGPAKGVLASANALHLCYCHSPMRYLWELYPAYLREHTRSSLKRALMIPAASALRLWDYASAARVDAFLANSDNTRRRILRAYRREAEVVHPPVDAATFRWEPSEDYYLAVSELVAYKQLDYAIRCCSRGGRRLIVAGDGPEFRRLRSMASGRVEFCGRVSDAELRTLYARCRAFLLPGEEDFGITMVESLASGKPIIALGRGGAREVVSEPHLGILYGSGNEEALHEAIEEFERREDSFEPAVLQARAAQFSEERFHALIRHHVESHSSLSPRARAQRLQAVSR